MGDVGVLAYGSLWDDPGTELAAATDHRIRGIVTPFRVEYARTSSTRGGAPTLVPVDKGGSAVAAGVLVMKEGVDVVDARNRTYRREIRQVGSDVTYRHLDQPVRGHIWLPITHDVDGVSETIYTVLDANIPIKNRTAASLADMAIKSVSLAPPGKDGITYLRRNVERGIVTPLTSDFRAAILEQTETRSLTQARERSVAM